MIKRISVLFLLTGTGHFFSVASLKFIAQQGLLSEVTSMGEVDSLILFMLGLIGFGMQSDTIRNIALSDQWETKYQQAQTARLTLSILLIPLSFLAFSKNTYFCFIIAPLLALSGDYALYGRGLPIIGSGVAFVRAVLPTLASIGAVLYWPKHLVIIYVTANILTYTLTNVFIAFVLKVKLVNMPQLSSLLLYMKTMPLGILNLCYYYLGLGLLLFAQLFYTETDLAVVFMALKFYVIYKSAVRIILQAFIKQMHDARVCLSIDQMTILLSILFFGSVVIFPNTFISLFFGNQFVDQRHFFTILFGGTVVFSFFSSSNFSLILHHHDRKMMTLGITAVAVISLFLWSYLWFSKSVNGVALSLLFGETFFSCGVLILFYNFRDIWSRASFLLLNTLVLAIPLVTKLIFSDSLLNYITSFGITGLLLLAFSYKKFKLPALIEKESEQ